MVANPQKNSGDNKKVLDHHPLNYTKTFLGEANLKADHSTWQGLNSNIYPPEQTCNQSKTYNGLKTHVYSA